MKNTSERVFVDLEILKVRFSPLNCSPIIIIFGSRSDPNLFLQIPFFHSIDSHANFQEKKNNKVERKLSNPLIKPV
jgi:hypothetical protein